MPSSLSPETLASPSEMQREEAGFGERLVQILVLPFRGEPEHGL